MDYKRYRRYFIILEREDSGFDNKPGKSPKGYTKIEIKNGKGILSHFVQNLKYDEKAPYIFRGYLVGTAGKKLIYVDSGSIVIDQQGKGELNWSFDPGNVDGKGNAIDDFNVIAIVGEKLGTTATAIAAPLVGFIDKKKVPWKNAFIKMDISEKQEVEAMNIEPVKEKGQVVVEAEVQKEQVEKEGVAEKEEKIALPVEPEEAVRKKESVEIVGVQELEVSKEETVQKDAMEEKPVDIASIVSIEKEAEGVLQDKYPEVSIFEKPIDQMIVKPIDTEIKKVMEEKKEIKKDQRIEAETKASDPQTSQGQKGIFNQYEDLELEQAQYHKAKSSPQHNQQNFTMAVNYVKNVLKHYEKVEPFEKNLEAYQWWKIPSSPQTMQRGFPPFYGYISNMYTYYPYMNYMTGYPDLIYKYQHYIFGLKADEKDAPIYFVYGVPGKFALSEQPYEGMTGFVYWHSMQNKEPQLGDYGYWILHIDAKTGTVAMPLKPTPPPGY